MGYSRIGLLEIEMYTFLALRLMGLVGQVHEASAIPSERTTLPCAGSWISPWLDFTGKEKRNISCH